MGHIDKSQEASVSICVGESTALRPCCRAKSRRDEGEFFGVIFSSPSQSVLSTSGGLGATLWSLRYGSGLYMYCFVHLNGRLF